MCIRDSIIGCQQFAQIPLTFPQGFCKIRSVNLDNLLLRIVDPRGQMSRLCDQLSGDFLNSLIKRAVPRGQRSACRLPALRRDQIPNRFGPCLLYTSRCV